MSVLLWKRLPRRRACKIPGTGISVACKLCSTVHRAGSPALRLVPFVFALLAAISQESRAAWKRAGASTLATSSRCKAGWFLHPLYTPIIGSVDHGSHRLENFTKPYTSQLKALHRYAESLTSPAATPYHTSRRRANCILKICPTKTL